MECRMHNIPIMLKTITALISVKHRTILHLCLSSHLTHRIPFALPELQTPEHPYACPSSHILIRPRPRIPLLPRITRTPHNQLLLPDHGIIPPSTIPTTRPPPITLRPASSASPKRPRCLRLRRESLLLWLRLCLGVITILLW